MHFSIALLEMGVQDGHNWWVRASAGALTAVGRSLHPTKVAGESTNPCTSSSLATKNVFDVLQDLFDEIIGSPRPQLDAADALSEPITHSLHQSLAEALEGLEILSLHAVLPVSCKRQLQLKVGALCSEVEKFSDMLLDTGTQISLVKACLLPPKWLTTVRGPWWEERRKLRWRCSS